MLAVEARAPVPRHRPAARCRHPVLRPRRAASAALAAASPCKRQPQFDGGAHAGRRADVERAAELRGKAVHHRQAQARCPCPGPWSRRRARSRGGGFLRPCRCRYRSPTARRAAAQAGRASAPCGPACSLRAPMLSVPPSRHGVARVHAEIEQRHLELVAVGHARAGGRQGCRSPPGSAARRSNSTSSLISAMTRRRSIACGFSG